MIRRNNKAKLQTERKQKRDIRVFLCILFVFVGFLIVSMIYKDKNPFIYKEHLEDTIITVDGAEVTLREFGYYIYEVEAFVNEKAQLYDSENKKKFWNLYFRAGIKSTYMQSLANKQVYDNCVCDLVYENLAREGGYTLSKEEEEKALQLAKKAYRKMTAEQIEITGVSQSIVDKIMKRRVLVAKYAKDMVEHTDFSGYKGYREDLISSEGDYYKEKILPKYQVKINQKLKSKVKIGRITINLDS